MMQKRTLYSLLLISFIAVYAFSSALGANTVTFESKNSARCANGVLNITAANDAAVNAVEIVFTISSASGGAKFSSYSVVLDPALTGAFTTANVDLSQADGTLPDTVRIYAIGGTLSAGSRTVGKVNFTTSDVCSGTVKLDAVVYDYATKWNAQHAGCSFGCGFATPTIQTQYATKTALVAVTTTAGIVTVVNSAPTIASIPNATLPWGQTYTGTAVGSDPDMTYGCEQLTYAKVSGPAALTVDPNSGAITWPTLGKDVCVSTVTVKVTDKCGASAQTSFDICVTNQPPTIACPAQTIVIILGDTAKANIVGTDPDSGPYPLKYKLLSFNGPGTATLNPSTGAFSWPTVYNDVNYLGHYSATVMVTDSANTCSPCSPENADTCSFNIEVDWGKLAIDKVHKQLQGKNTTVNVTLGTNYPIGGFDLLFSYDPSVLSFNQAVAGSFLTECGWEYFTYRYGTNGNCGSGCPTGYVHVVAMAETNNGANHPTCFTSYDPPRDSIAVQLSFFVSNDRTLNCQFVPIRFFWTDCGDNAMSTISGDSLLISRKVFDYYGTGGTDTWVEITNTGAAFPSLFGANTDCDASINPDKPKTWRAIDFFNGGIDIVCSDSIDARGDINQNGQTYEIADAVMFTNYFLHGLSAFDPYRDAATAASDVNADGVPLTVADLVYMIRVIVGDVQPYAKDVVNQFDAVSVAYTLSDGNLAITDGTKMGAIALVVEGNVTPTTSTNADLQYAFDGTNTRIIMAMPMNVKSDGFTGHVLSGLNGNVVSIDMATALAQPVSGKLIPTAYALSQNYPNPFNPSTTIKFALPVGGQYELTIYNVNGQVVKTFTDAGEAGYHEVVWDASSVASGVYFYRLSAGSYTEVRKMMLLK
jgi:hypothetical protein